MATYDVSAPKRAANLSINSDLLRRARAESINLSGLVEERIAEELRRRYREQWLERNRRALEGYGERLAQRGLFGDGLRRF